MSCTTIVLLQVEVFPQSSVAIHVLVTEYAPGQFAGDDASLNVNETLASHISDAVALPNEGTDGHVIGEVTSGQVIAGGVLSIT